MSVRTRTAASVALGVAGLCGALACATSAAPSPPSREASPCSGLTPPRPLMTRPVELPATYAAARLSADVPAEATIARDGTVRDPLVRTAELSMLAPFAEATVSRTKFQAGSFENNPAAIRVPFRIAVGSPRSREELRAPADVWAHVAAGESREARWQLRDSVTKLTVTAHVPGFKAPEGAIVAVAPDGQTKTLVKLSPSSSPQDVRQTVSAGKFFAAAGEYRLELRAGGTLASAHLTIANDYNASILNACEPLALPKKAGPGN